MLFQGYIETEIIEQASTIVIALKQDDTQRYIFAYRILKPLKVMNSNLLPRTATYADYRN